MLVLSRKVGEPICIGSDVRITITRITAATVRLAIAAPEDVVILRSELLESKPCEPVTTISGERV